MNKKEEFESLLSNYQMSDEAKAMLAELKLLLLVSPTGAGRNTIINQLSTTGKYHYVLSDTTRPQRSNNGEVEKEGSEYHFVSEEDFLEGLKTGRYIEAAVIHNQQVSGISIDELSKAASQDKIAVNEVEIIGADVIHTEKPDTTTIFVLPPSYEQWMSRLEQRGDMTTEEITNRLESAEKELQAAIDKDYFKLVINDDLEQAVEQIRRIVESDDYSQQHHQDATELAWQLLGQVKRQLRS